MNKKRSITIIIAALAILFINSQHSLSCEKVEPSKGQSIYVPAYSHIYIGNNEKQFLLTVTLSIRNIDPKHSIKVTLVDYYETQGQLLHKYITEPVVLKPLESLRYVVPEKDKTGGSGANFIVEWRADKLVIPPVAESIMIGARSTQGISFSSRGRVISSEQ